jgi:ABC-2 type transport system ATP-binding protein
LGDDLAIRCEGLTRYHGGTPGVVDLDMQVPRGEVFGFLGPNGAGKTTTIRLFLDLLRPDRGRAVVLGHEVANGAAKLRSRIGYLPGDLALFPRATGLETLDFFSDLQARSPVARESVLGALGFPLSALARKSRTYSTGMRQMIGLAIAFQHAPELLILDEPTTGLDPLVRDAFLNLVRGARDRGATVFLSSHVLDEVDRVADRVGLIAESRLRMVSSMRELREKWPRQVWVRSKDGGERTFESDGAIGALLEELRALDPEDIQIRRAGLDHVFRKIVNENRA